MNKRRWLLINSLIEILPTNLNWLCVIIVSMLPMFEIKGAVPFALSSAVWGNGAMPIWKACLFSFFGASLVALVLLLVVKLIALINKRKKKKLNRFDLWLNEKFFRYKKNAKTKKWFVLMFFTAVPLPFSGVWSAVLLSAFLKMKFWSSASAIILGNVFTALIVGLFCGLFADLIDLVLMAFLVVVALVLIFYLIKSVLMVVQNKKCELNNKNCK